MINLLCNMDWSAISAIASLIMAFATFLALWQNRNQVGEMKRQWLEEHKPNIDARFVSKKGDEAEYIQLTNYGKGVAENIKISFETSFLEKLPDLFASRLEHISSKRYNILPNSVLLIYFGELSYDEKRKEFILNDHTKLSESEGFKLYWGLHDTKFVLNIEYGNKHQYKSSFELQFGMRNGELLSTTGVLNSINQQINLLRESIKQQ